MGRHNARLTGRVKRVVNERGFGFIVLDDSSVEYFFHFSGCKGCRIEDLNQGTRVSFVATSGTKGPRAEEIELA